MRAEQRARPDAQLLAAGDEGSFAELYRRHVGDVHAWLYGRVAWAAADLTAETFAQAWLARLRFRDRAGGTAGPWLFAIARNVLVSSVRRRRLERTACERLGLSVDAWTAPDETWLEGLDEALGELPDGQADAIRLRVVDELEYDEVALCLDTTPAAVRVRVHRGLHSLRQRLRERTEAR
jgi:RNA polymerase sigma-70 factor, ECF subfamily